ncbi:MAG TPA: hypothetical protein VIN71_13805, partial [Pseudomonadales bacterium]
PLLLVLLVVLIGGGVAAIWFAPQYAAGQPSLMAAHERLMQWLGIVDPVEQEIERRLAAAQAAEQQRQYLEPAGSSALDHYRAILSLRSDHPAAKAGIAAIVEWLLGQAREAISEQDFARAEQRLDRAALIDANADGLAVLRDALAAERARLAEEEAARQAEALARQQRLEAERLANEQRSAAEAARQRELAARRAAEQAAAEKARQEALRKQQEAELLRQQELDRQRAEEEAAAAMFRNVRIRGLLAKADTHFTRGEYYRPAGENALDAYVEVLSLDGDSIAAKAGIEKTMERIIPELERLLQAQQFDQARDLYQQLRDKAPASSNLLSFGDSKGW